MRPQRKIVYRSVLHLGVSFWFLLSEQSECSEPLQVKPTLSLIAEGTQDQDDACIWIHPKDASQSTVIASDKSGGKLIVYDLTGKALQILSVPKPGNIDIRQNVKLDGFSGDLVAVNQRTNGYRLLVFRVDPDSRTLVRIDGDRVLTGPNYGGCLYHSQMTGKLYFLCTADSGKVEQHEIMGDQRGDISGRLVRSWQLKKCEGAVADDEAGFFYIAEEQGDIWKVRAEPDQSFEGTRITGVGEHGMTGDLEGVAIYKRPDFPRCLIVSDQKQSRFLIFGLQAPYPLLGSFTVDGAANTDGIDITSANLGLSFPNGLFICHTDRSPRPLLVTPCQALLPLK